MQVWGWVGISVQNRGSCRGPGKLEEGRLTRRGAFYVFDGGRGERNVFCHSPVAQELKSGGRGNGVGRRVVCCGGRRGGGKEENEEKNNRANKQKTSEAASSVQTLAFRGRSSQGRASGFRAESPSVVLFGPPEK